MVAPSSLGTLMEKLPQGWSWGLGALLEPPPTTVHPRMGVTPRWGWLLFPDLLRGSVPGSVPCTERGGQGHRGQLGSCHLPGEGGTGEAAWGPRSPGQAHGGYWEGRGQDVTPRPLRGGHNKKDPRERCCQLEKGSGWPVGAAGGWLHSFPLPGRWERLDVGRVGSAPGARPGWRGRFLESLSGGRLGRACVAGPGEGTRPAHPSGTRSCSAPPQAGRWPTRGDWGQRDLLWGAERGRRVARDGVRVSGCALAGRKRPVTRIRLCVPSSCWDGSRGRSRGQRWWQRSRRSPSGLGTPTFPAHRIPHPTPLLLWVLCPRVAGAVPRGGGCCTPGCCSRILGWPTVLPACGYVSAAAWEACGG